MSRRSPIRDIRALYRRELLERFSAFAFPPREAAPARQPAAEPARRRASCRQAARATAAQRCAEPRDGGARDALARGGARRARSAIPAEIARHAEALAALADRRPRASTRSLEALLDAPTALESERLATILPRKAFAAPPPEDYAALRFPCSMDRSADEPRASDLAEAIGLLVERPALEAALAAATERFETRLPDEAFAEQQRLLQTKAGIRCATRGKWPARAQRPSIDRGRASQTTAE